MNDITSLVQRLIARTRRRLLLRAALGSSLGLACAGLAALRLHQAGVASGRITLISAGILALTAAWQWWSIRRDRPAVGAIADLDRELGLSARLLTAVEFADAPTPPVLYSRLLEETAKALPDVQRRLPPVMDRPAMAMAIAALVLLLWPSANAPVQLAMTLPPSATPPEIPPIMPPEPPPQPQPPSGTSQDQQSNQQQNQQQNQSQSGGQDQQKQQPQPGQSGDQSKESQGNQQQDQSSGSGQQPQAAGGQQSQQPSGQQAKSGQSQQQAQAGKDGTSGAEQASGQSKDASKQGQQGGDKGEANSAQLAAKNQKGDAGKVGANAGSPSDAAQQQALKADIQQLLKELSSELKEMQAEMDAKQPSSKEPSPLAGTSTDSNLYEQPAKLEKASGSRLPIQLEVDSKPVTSPRKGSGTGQASKQASDALPQQEPESATLSDVRTTEQGQARHAIPPDYQPVFERLSPNPQKEGTQ